MGNPVYKTPCPEGIFEMTFIVNEKQTDTYGRMKISDMARQMQKATEGHMETYGITAETLKEENKAWVIAWTAMNIFRLPESGEEVILRIWPGKNKAVMYTRMYAFYDKDGHSLASVSSMFIMMDLKTRGVAAPSESVKKIPVITVDGESSVPKMRETMPVLTHSVDRVVSLSEIDFNGHMNNTFYLDWADDIRHIEKMDGIVPDYVWVHYNKELKEGENARLFYEVTRDALYITGKGEEDSFAVKMQF